MKTHVNRSIIFAFALFAVMAGPAGAKVRDRMLV